MLRSKELLNDAEPRWQKVACCFIKQKDCLIVHHYEVKQVSWRWQNAASLSNQRLFGSLLVLAAILASIQQSCLLADRQQLC